MPAITSVFTEGADMQSVPTAGADLQYMHLATVNENHSDIIKVRTRPASIPASFFKKL